ncbi:MAG: transporter [Variovorax sp.]|nr:transporter [Variovorax sp.]
MAARIGFCRQPSGAPIAALAAVLVAALAAVALTGCTVGPDYRGPPNAAPLSSAAGAFRRADATESAASPPSRWWDALGDPALTHVIDLALAQSPTLRAAQARILQARATLARQRAASYPSVTATGAAIAANLPPNSPLAALGGSGSNSASGNSSSQATTGAAASGTGASGSTSTGSGSGADTGRQTVDFYSAGFDALWEIDFFGGLRRGVEGARARVESAAARYEDAQVQLAAEVGQAYAALRGVQAQIRLAQTTLGDQQRLLELAESRRRHGTADDLDVERARAQFLRARADLVPLMARRDESLDQLALLSGQEPGTLDKDLLDAAPLPALPATVAVGDPAAMLRRRPDVRAAERALASSNAAIGQAIAQRFPRVRLIGDIGFSSGQASDLFNKNNLMALGGPVLQWNFLNFGSTQAQVRQARAANDEAVAQYEGAVLAALQDAESSLSRFGHQRDNVYQLSDARDSAARASGLARRRYAGGTASQIDVLTADTQRIQVEQSLAQSQAELLRDYVALQKSLGLGWTAAPDEDRIAADGR